MIKVDSIKNTVIVGMHIESESYPEEGDYKLFLISNTNELDINSVGGVDDITLIKECIDNTFDFANCIDEGYVRLSLVETGDFEGPHWHKYYKIDCFEMHEYL